MRKFDLTGMKFHRWSVIAWSGSGNWLCRCQCGTERDVASHALRSELSKSCGCWNLEQARRPKKHGMSKSGEFKTWAQVIDRCTNTNSPSFPRYGGRGIRVCQRWLDSFNNFFEDMGRRPRGLTIERIDNEGNYEPGNCRWATNREQQRNKRTNRWLEANGRKALLTDWARELGCDPSLLLYHINQGKTLEQTINFLCPVFIRCVECGTPFATRHREAKYCGEKCSERARAKRRYGKAVA